MGRGLSGAAYSAGGLAGGYEGEESDNLIAYGASPREGRAGLLRIMLGLTRRENISRLPGTAAVLSRSHYKRVSLSSLGKQEKKGRMRQVRILVICLILFFFGFPLFSQIGLCDYD